MWHMAVAPTHHVYSATMLLVLTPQSSVTDVAAHSAYLEYLAQSAGNATA